MSDRPDDELLPPLDDPFLAEDPAARERERRRLQREAKRRARDNRQSLATRVSGALDAAASKGREAVEQTRERAKDPNPPAEGVDPPPFRRPLAAPRAPEAPERPAPEARPKRSAPKPVPPVDPRPEPPARAPAPVEPVPAPPASAGPPAPAAGPGDEHRVAAEVAMPRRPARRPLDTEDAEAVTPEPVVARPRPEPSEIDEWIVPPPAGPPIGAPGGGDGQRRDRAAGHGGWHLWRRRLLALVALIAIAAGAVYGLSRVGDDDSAPAPKGPKRLKTTSVTIPEGLTADEMASVARKAGLKGDYEKAVKAAAKRFNPKRYGAPKDASLEGFLFPATYEVEKGAPVRDLVDKQLEAFDQNLAQVDLSYAKKKNLNVYDVVTIASMIEREVQVPSERPIVSSVIYNRLSQGIPLEIDATVRYAIGNDYSKPLTPSDLQVDSPYNTYRYPGLPQGPIANPGLDSLVAAAKPSDDDYLYYVVKPGTCGEHFFTKDYDEFLAASQKYDAAQAAAGGSPTEC